MPNIEIPESVLQWKIGSLVDTNAPIRSWNNYTDNDSYNLFCKKIGKYLTYIEKVPLGISLSYTNDRRYCKTHFRLPDGKEREILSGESVAVGIGLGKAFLRYANRPVGINLDWSQEPVFEWRIFGSNLPEGTPIPENSWVAIVNDRVEPKPDFLVHFDRPPKMADIGWTSSPGFWDAIVNTLDQHKVEIAKVAIAALA